MLLFDHVRAKQIEVIKSCKKEVADFISSIDTSKLKLILLSGSVARGTFMPEENGGAIDLIFFTRDKTYNPTIELGRDLEAHIPGHFIKFRDVYLQIKIYNDAYLSIFTKQHEAEKYAFLESEILLSNDEYIEETIKDIIENKVPDNIIDLYRRAFGYCRYLMSDYKVDRWKNRNAVLQLNVNLNHALNQAIRCLFYINGKYYPAEDRALYFSLNLERIPRGLSEIYKKILMNSEDTLESYNKRELLFKRELLGFISRTAKNQYQERK